MMKHLLAASGTAALMTLLSGCYYTQIATPAASPEMQEWESIIKESYPGYTPPKTTMRSYDGIPEKRFSTPAKSQLKPMDDINPAATQPEAVSADEIKEIPAEEIKPAEPAIAEVKPDAKPAEEVQAEEPKAEEPKAEEPKAGEPKAEEPKAEEPKAEEPKAEEPKAEEPKAEETKAPAAQDNALTPPDPTNSTVYEVKSGDTLGSISVKMYGSARFSNIIFRANTDILKDANKLRPGMKLIVPKL